MSLVIYNVFSSDLIDFSNTISVILPQKTRRKQEEKKEKKEK